MAYRPTERTEARKAAVRGQIVAAARRLVAHGGYGAAQVAAVAREAGVATGTVYRYFPSKAELFAEVFRSASQHEVDAVVAAAADDGATAPARIDAAVETFARRALRGRRLAWALIAERRPEAVRHAKRLLNDAPDLSAAEALALLGPFLAFVNDDEDGADHRP